MLYQIALIALLWASFSSATPTGEHTCLGVIKHPVEVEVNVTEPFLFRTYIWCLRIPPRCSKYISKLREVVKVQTEMHNKTITVCCKGYVEMDYKCVPACPPLNECPNMKCNSTNHCHCIPGYAGTYCTEPCPKGSWGVDCKKTCDCPEGYTCHHLTGDCMIDEPPKKKTPKVTFTSSFTSSEPEPETAPVRTTRRVSAISTVKATEKTTTLATTKRTQPTTIATTAATEKTTQSTRVSESPPTVGSTIPTKRPKSQERIPITYGTASVDVHNEINTVETTTRNMKPDSTRDLSFDLSSFLHKLNIGQEPEATTENSVKTHKPPTSLSETPDDLSYRRPQNPIDSEMNSNDFTVSKPKNTELDEPHLTTKTSKSSHRKSKGDKKKKAHRVEEEIKPTPIDIDRNLEVTDMPDSVETNTIAALSQTDHIQLISEDEDVDSVETIRYQAVETFKKIEQILTEPRAAEVQAERSDKTMQDFWSGFVTTLGCIFLISIIVLTGYYVKKWAYDRNKSVLDEIIMAYGPSPQNTMGAPLYPNANFSLLDQETIGTTFYCQKYTNDCVERLSRELKELEYDHPRNFGDHLYEEIEHH